jgi:hypothetical protein
MNIQHFLKPVTFTAGVTRRHAIMIRIDGIKYFLVYKLT